MAIAKHLLEHLGLTLLVAGFWVWQAGNWWLVLPAILFGVLVDIDHWIDYFGFFGFKLNLKKFFNPATYIKPAKRVYILFHAWEYLLPLFFISRFLETKLLVPGLTGIITSAYLTHLVFDTIIITQSPKSYSLIYRRLNQFKLEAFNEK